MCFKRLFICFQSQCQVPLQIKRLTSLSPKLRTFALIRVSACACVFLSWPQAVAMKIILIFSREGTILYINENICMRCFLLSRPWILILCYLSPNAVLRLRFNHFATECSWDHMYVYDGDSIYAPLIAVFRSANSSNVS